MFNKRNRNKYFVVVFGVFVFSFPATTCKILCLTRILGRGSMLGLKVEVQGYKGSRIWLKFLGENSIY